MVAPIREASKGGRGRERAVACLRTVSVLEAAGGAGRTSAENRVNGAASLGGVQVVIGMFALHSGQSEGAQTVLGIEASVSSARFCALVYSEAQEPSTSSAATATG